MEFPLFHHVAHFTDITRDSFEVQNNNKVISMYFSKYLCVCTSISIYLYTRIPQPDHSLWCDAYQTEKNKHDKN